MLATRTVQSLTAVRTHTIVTDAFPVAGEGGARIGRGGPVLRVFGDYECAACRELERVAGDSLRSLARHGRLTFVYHHAPLRAHRRGPLAAAAAYCAGRLGSPWRAHRALYEAASLWHAGENPIGRLAAAVARSGADPARLRACIESGATRTQVEHDRALADQLGIDVVPTIYLGDERISFQSYRALLRYLTRRTSAS
jgi:protein-disulfide isomerase